MEGLFSLFPIHQKKNGSEVVGGNFLMAAPFSTSRETRSDSLPSSSNSANVSWTPNFLFCANSQRDRDNWVQALNKAIEEARSIALQRKNNSSDGEDLIGSGGVIDFEKSTIELQEVLGSGGSGCKVHRCTVDGLSCAVKILKMKGQPSVVIEQFLSEISIMEQLHHHNIAKYLGHRFTKNPDRIWLFMEYYPYSIQKILDMRSGVRLPHKDIAYIALEVAKGMEFLHSLKPPIIHRDLKCGNALCTLDEESRVQSIKLTDFDTSKVTSKGTTLLTSIGTTPFMAPEVLHPGSVGYTIKADIFSFGMVLVELITLKPPYSRHPGIHAAKLVLAGTPPELPEDLSPSFDPILQLLKECTNYDPSKRPTALQVVGGLKKILKGYNEEGEK